VKDLWHRYWPLLMVPLAFLLGILAILLVLSDGELAPFDLGP